MNLDIFRGPAAATACLITSNDGRTRILADAGLPDAYSSHIAARARPNCASDGHALMFFYVSHIDEDHIGGVVGMLDAELAWRVFDHMKAKGRPWKQPKFPRPPKIKQIWHNAFLETIAASNAKIDCGARSGAGR